MKILGIDPGFGRLGFGCIQSNAGTYAPLDYGIVSTDPTQEQSYRLFQIYQDVETLLEEHHPDLIAIEKLFFKNNISTGIRVAEARGVILLLSAKHHIQTIEFNPAQIKKAVTGDGAADKAAMTRMVCQLLKLSRAPKIDDAADALAIALTAAAGRWS